MILHCVSHLQVCKTFWDVRKGLIPIVGAAREPGTSMLIEDVACPVDKLADMMIDLIDMFQRCAVDDTLAKYVCACMRFNPVQPCSTLVQPCLLLLYVEQKRAGFCAVLWQERLRRPHDVAPVLQQQQ